MELTPTSSSRDTEPMSSTTLARIRRTMTAPETYTPQSSTHSMDELALPISFEVAIPRHRSQTAQSRNNLQFSSTDHQQTHADDGSDLDELGGEHIQEHENSEFIGSQNVVAAEEIGVENDECVETELQTTTAQDDHEHEHEHENEHQQDVIIEAHGESQGPEHIPKSESVHASHKPESKPSSRLPSPESATPQEIVERPPKRSRKGRKKKLKRGKTTSAVLRKTIESDVEDDVIWIDEKKSTPAVIDDSDASDDILNLDEKDGIFINSNNKNNINRNVQREELSSHVIAAKAEVEEPIIPETNDIQNQQSVSAPKKRGRKRKKTADEEPLTTPGSRQQITDSNVDLQIPLPEPDALPPPPSPSPSPSKSRMSSLAPHEYEDVNPPESDHGGIHDGNPFAEEDNLYNEPIQLLVETPKKPIEKGPDKHSPISINNRVSYRVGLSRKARIAPLLKIVRK